MNKILKEETLITSLIISGCSYELLIKLNKKKKESKINNEIS